MLPNLTTLRARRSQTGVLALALAGKIASSPGQSFLIAVFVDEILRDSGLTRTGFSVVYAAGTVVSAAAMVLVGRVADRLGLRATWIIVSLGLAGACMLASFVTGLVTAFFALALLRTFGQGSFPLVSTLLVARSFHGRRGQAIASASLGLTLASVVLPPAVVALVLEVGWRDAYRILGVAVAVLILPLAFFARTPPARAAAAGPAAGRSIVGQYPRAMRRSRTLPRLRVPTIRAGRLLFVVSAPALVMTAVIFHAVSLFADRGLSLRGAGFGLSLLGLSMAAGTLAAGAIADRTRTRGLLTAMSGLLLVSMLTLLVPAAATAYLGFLLLGLGGGVFAVAGGIVWPRTYGLEEIGRLQGTATSVVIAAAAVGPLPLAISRALADSYAPALVLLAAYALVALVTSLRWRDPRAVRLRGHAGA